MRRQFAGQKILVEACKGTSEGADLPVGPGLCRQPSHAVIPILFFCPSLVTKRIPGSLRSIATARVLDRHHKTVACQKLRRLDTYHYGLMLAVRSSFQEHGMDSWLNREI